MPVRWSAALVFVLATLALGCAGAAGPAGPSGDDASEASIGLRSSVALVPLGGDLLGGAPVSASPVGRDVYYRLFGLLLAEETYARIIETAALRTGPGGLSAADEVLPAFSLRALPGQGFNVVAPEGGISVAGRVPDYVLVVSDLGFEVSIEREQLVVGNVEGGGVSLEGACTFALWDAESLELVAAEQVTARTDASADLSSWQPYARVLQGLAVQIVRRSPLAPRALG